MGGQERQSSGPDRGCPAEGMTSRGKRKQVSGENTPAQPQSTDLALMKLGVSDRKSQSAATTQTKEMKDISGKVHQNLQQNTRSHFFSSQRGNKTYNQRGTRNHLFRVVLFCKKCRGEGHVQTRLFESFIDHANFQLSVGLWIKCLPRSEPSLGLAAPWKYRGILSAILCHGREARGKRMSSRQREFIK